jgi:hypothetical protein
MTLTVPEGEVDGLKVERFEVKPFDRHNLRQEIKHGRGTRPGMYTRLIDYKSDEFWMSDTDAEKEDHVEPVNAIEFEKAERVLINGLGMVLTAALSYDHVKHVDVVESDERVIKLVGPHYTKDPRVNIIHGDAYKTASPKVWARGTRWDVVWSDIWPAISTANLPGMDQLHKFYRRRSVYHGMRARKMCLRLRREEKAYGLV